MRNVIIASLLILFSACSKDSESKNSHLIEGIWKHNDKSLFLKFSNTNHTSSDIIYDLDDKTGLPYFVDSDTLIIDRTSYGVGEDKYQIILLNAESLHLKSLIEVFGDLPIETYRRIKK